MSPALHVTVEDLLVLARFYEVTGGEQWLDSGGWKPDAPAADPCISSTHFTGVGCRDPCRNDMGESNCRLGRITRLELNFNSLSGARTASHARDERAAPRSACMGGGGNVR